MFTLYWTKCISSKLPSIRFTVSTSANSYTELTGWAGWKKWTLPPSPTLRFPLAQCLLATVLSLPGLDYSSKEKDWQTALYILHSDESHLVKFSWLLPLPSYLFFHSHYALPHPSSFPLSSFACHQSSASFTTT